MRIFFALILATTLCGCITVSNRNPRQYMDLSQPIYLVTRQSFWDGCSQNNLGYEACRHLRIAQVYQGAHEWFKYFDQSSRPLVVVVNSPADVPWDTVNEPVYLAIDKDFCKKIFGKDYLACYYYGSRSEIQIVFVSEFMIPVFMNHELGHALGRSDNDVPENTSSVMSYAHPSPVSPLDFAMMCRLHPECRMMKHRSRRK